MNQPLISIIVPCYNQAQYLDECLQSVLDQTYENWECILINDGSTDNTEIIAKNWTKKDPRFKYISKKNAGRSSARNTGLELALGDWIQFLDADDIILKRKFEKSMQYSKDYNLIVTNFNLLDDKKSILPPFCDISKYSLTRKNIIHQWDVDFNIPIHTILVKKELLFNIFFDEILVAKEDWFFWLEVFSKNIHPKFIDEHLVYYRINPYSVGKDSQWAIKSYQRIYKKADEELKQNIFERICIHYTHALEERDFFQRSYNSIRNMRIVKAYLKLRKTFK